MNMVFSSWFHMVLIIELYAFLGQMGLDLGTWTIMRCVLGTAWLQWGAGGASQPAGRATSRGGRRLVQRWSQGSWFADGDDQVTIFWCSLQRCTLFFHSTREVVFLSHIMMRLCWLSFFLTSWSYSDVGIGLCCAPGPVVLRCRHVFFCIRSLSRI